MPERVRALDVAELKNFDFWCALRILGNPNLNNDLTTEVDFSNAERVRLRVDQEQLEKSSSLF